MYRKNDKNQFNIYDFIHPFGGKLKSDNRWVVLHDSIDWDMIEECYEKNFDNAKTGNEAYPASVAFGSLYIQRKKRLKDREVPTEIAENPYLQCPVLRPGDRGCSCNGGYKDGKCNG